MYIIKYINPIPAIIAAGIPIYGIDNIGHIVSTSTNLIPANNPVIISGIYLLPFLKSF